MATIGTLVVEMRANAAQFHAELEKARKGLKGTGQEAAGSTRLIARYAADGLGAVLPISNKVENALETLIVKVTASKGAFSALGPAVIVAGAALAGFAIGNALANFRDLRKEGHGFVEALKLAVGAVESYEERIRKAGEEEKKFNDQLQRAGALRADLAKQLSGAKGDGAILGAQFADDKAGEAKAALDKRLDAIEFERKARERNAIQQTKDEVTRQEFLKQGERIASQERHNAQLDASIKLRQIQDDATAKQLTVWKDETAQFKAQLDQRIEIQRANIAQTIAAIEKYATKRSTLEASIGSGGVAGTSVTKGFGLVKDLAGQIQNEIKQIALLKQTGRLSPQEAVQALQGLLERVSEQSAEIRKDYGGVTSVVRELDKVLAGSSINDYVTRLIAFRDELTADDAAMVSLTEQLRQQQAALTAIVDGGLAQFQQMLNAVPASAEGARTAVQSLTQQFWSYTQAVNASNDAVRQALELAAEASA